jgi:hypothetical protein
MGYWRILYEYVGGVVDEEQRGAERNQPYSGTKAIAADNMMALSKHTPTPPGLRELARSRFAYSPSNVGTRRSGRRPEYHSNKNDDQNFAA